jgi:hypothetical protein
MGDGTIASLAKARVDAARDSTADRYRLAAEFYGGRHTGSQRRRYQRAELSFLRLDYGIISSRLAELYEFAALSLEEPRVCTFVSLDSASDQPDGQDHQGRGDQQRP